MIRYLLYVRNLFDGKHFLNYSGFCDIILQDIFTFKEQYCFTSYLSKWRVWSAGHLNFLSERDSFYLGLIGLLREYCPASKKKKHVRSFWIELVACISSHAFRDFGLIQGCSWEQPFSLSVVNFEFLMKNKRNWRDKEEGCCINQRRGKFKRCC